MSNTIHLVPTSTPTVEPAGEVLRPKQAAKYLHLSHRTLETMRTRGDGPPFCKYGEGRSARVVYRRCDLDAWLESRVRLSTMA